MKNVRILRLTPFKSLVGVGAQNGILVKNAESIERAEKVTHLITDKTGTLTEGKPSVVEVESAEGQDASKWLALAAAVESQSEHPLARAVVDQAKAKELPIPGISDFESTTGGGVHAQVEGQLIRVGKRSFIESNGISISEKLGTLAERLQGEAQTVIWVSGADQLFGLIAIADPIKKTSKEAIESLHAMGITVVMCTGDNTRTAQAVAQELAHL